MELKIRRYLVPWGFESPIAAGIKNDSQRLGDPKYPSFDLSSPALGWLQLRIEELRQGAFRILPSHPFGCRESVVLIRSSSLGREFRAPQRWVDLRYHRRVPWHRPPVERPKMHLGAEMLPKIS